MTRHEEIDYIKSIIKDVIAQLNNFESQKRGVLKSAYTVEFNFFKDKYYYKIQKTRIGIGNLLFYGSSSDEYSCVFSLLRDIIFSGITNVLLENIRIDKLMIMEDKQLLEAYERDKIYTEMCEMHQMD